MEMLLSGRTLFCEAKIHVPVLHHFDHFDVHARDRDEAKPVALAMFIRGWCGQCDGGERLLSPKFFADWKFFDFFFSAPLLTPTNYDRKLDSSFGFA